MKKFGEILREIVDESGLSQRAFAAKADVTQGTLSRLMGEESAEKLRPETLQGLIRAAGMDINRWRQRISGKSERLEDGISGYAKVIVWFHTLQPSERTAVIHGLSGINSELAAARFRQAQEDADKLRGGSGPDAPLPPPPPTGLPGQGPSSGPPKGPKGGNK